MAREPDRESDGTRHKQKESLLVSSPRGVRGPPLGMTSEYSMYRPGAKFRVRGRQGGCNQSDRVWSWMGMLRDEPKASPAAPSRRRVRPRRAEGESGRLLAVTSRRRVAAPLAPQAIFLNEGARFYSF